MGRSEEALPRLVTMVDTTQHPPCNHGATCMYMHVYVYDMHVYIHACTCASRLHPTQINGGDVPVNLDTNYIASLGCMHMHVMLCRGSGSLSTVLPLSIARVCFGKAAIDKRTEASYYIKIIVHT